jgi:hypothetical protein
MLVSIQSVSKSRPAGSRPVDRKKDNLLLIYCSQQFNTRWSSSPLSDAVLMKLRRLSFAFDDTATQVQLQANMGGRASEARPPSFLQPVLRHAAMPGRFAHSRSFDASFIRC